jgi:hypothetical protein
MLERRNNFMKTITVLLAAAICLVLAGCSNNDAEVKAFVNDRSDVAGKIASIIDANPTVAGVDEAQKFFDSKKVELKTRWDSIRGAKTSSDMDVLLNKSAAFDSDLFLKLHDKHVMKLSGDRAADSKFYSLITEFGGLSKT